MESDPTIQSRSGTSDLARIARFTLGQLHIDPPSRRISGGGRSEMLEPRVMRVLVALGGARGTVLSRDDLIASCWDGRIVGDKAITRAISLLRQAIEGLGDGTVRIETIAKVGFRIVADGGPANVSPAIPPGEAVHDQTGLGRRKLLVAGAGGLAALGAGWAAWNGKLFSPVQNALHTVAVLPFRNLSGDKNQDFFSEGLSEQIRTVLARNPKLRVLAPTSVAAAMEASSQSLAIAQKLGAAYLLDGSVRREGEQVRITARLTDAIGGTVAWTEQIDRQISNIFAVQDDIADSVAGALAAQTADARGHKNMGGTNNVQAYEAYLRSKAYGALRSGEASSRAALAQLDAAIAADPDYAEALAARAQSIIYIAGTYGKASELKPAQDDAFETARKAVALAPLLPFAQAILGFVYVHSKQDFKSAAAPYALARKLGWGDATVMIFVTFFHAELGQKRETASAVSRLIELDPLNPAVFRTAAFAAYSTRDFELAAGYCRKALTLNQRASSVHAIYGDCLLELGRVDEARGAYLVEPVDLLRLTGLAIAEWRLGNKAAAQRAYDDLSARLGDLATYQFARILAQWGRLDDAMAKLTFARQIGDNGLTVAHTDPLLDPLRGRPDFSLLLKDLGFD
ncbi:MAG: winged helix-turn-helix domain-containing protein [Novosphingobium sp.]